MDSLDMSRSHYIDICKVIGNSDQVEQCLPKLYDCMQGDSLNAPYNLHFTQLCQEKRILPLKWIKLSRDEKRRRITKLYFPPSKYPPPTSDNTEHKTMLGHLRNYIEKSAETGQSPVVCSGDNAQQKRFRCKYMCIKEGCNLNLRKFCGGTLTMSIHVPLLLLYDGINMDITSLY